MNRPKRILFSLFVIQTLYLFSVSGEGVIRNHIWLDYNPLWAIHNKISLYSDWGVRTVFPNNWYCYISQAKQEK